MGIVPHPKRGRPARGRTEVRIILQIFVERLDSGLALRTDWLKMGVIKCTSAANRRAQSGHR